MRVLIAGLLLGFTASPAWAFYTKAPGKPVDLSELTTEMKQLVPALEGCDTFTGVVRCRRLTGDFTEAEQTALDEALTKHDSNIRMKRQQQRQANREVFLQKLCQGVGFTGQDVIDCKSELQ